MTRHKIERKIISLGDPFKIDKFLRKVRDKQYNKLIGKNFCIIFNRYIEKFFYEKGWENAKKRNIIYWKIEVTLR